MDHRELSQRLQNIPVVDRVTIIAVDVESRRDEFRSLDPFSMASLLGVPNAERPGERGWTFTKYVKREPLSEYVEWVSPPQEVLYLLEGQVDEARYKDLMHEAGLIDKGVREFYLSLLSDEEQRLIESSIMEQTLDKLEGGVVIANSSIPVPNKEQALEFEALIECGGECITLLTPYDERDGLFADLSDCITECW
jgi:hypothetical protein